MFVQLLFPVLLVALWSPGANPAPLSDCTGSGCPLAAETLEPSSIMDGIRYRLFSFFRALRNLFGLGSDRTKESWGWYTPTGGYPPCPANPCPRGRRCFHGICIVVRTAAFHGGGGSESGGSEGGTGGGSGTGGCETIEDCQPGYTCVGSSCIKMVGTDIMRYHEGSDNYSGGGLDDY